MTTSVIPISCGCYPLTSAGTNDPPVVWNEQLVAFCPLHAAAPDLLKALEAVIQMVDETDYYNDRVLDQGRAAIKKARGES